MTVLSLQRSPSAFAINSPYNPFRPTIHIVGLADKAVAESRERVQVALRASSLSMPSKKVTVNLAPADLPKEGSHCDLPIALGLMAALGAIPGDMLAGYVGIDRIKRFK